MARNIPVIEIGNTHIQNGVEDIGKIENSKIKSVVFRPDPVLYGNIYSQNPKRLD